MEKMVINAIDFKDEIQITIKGCSDMPFWKHDLKFKAILCLLDSIDRKHFFE
jgi:hypothetical protein